MDNHHKTQHEDTRNGRDCQFCRNCDPNFEDRDPLDRLVVSKVNDSAGAHMTENGYVQHRMIEIGIRISVATGSRQHAVA
jgi:hypothetical protein